MKTNGYLKYQITITCLYIVINIFLFAFRPTYINTWFIFVPFLAYFIFRDLQNIKKFQEDLK